MHLAWAGASALARANNERKSMTLAMLFWVIMILSLLFNLWSAWPLNKQNSPALLVWILLALLGWAVFGAAIHR